MKTKKSNFKKCIARAMKRICHLSLYYLKDLIAPFFVFYYSLLGNIEVGNRILLTSEVFVLWGVLTICAYLIYIKEFYKKKRRFTFAFASISTCIIYCMKIYEGFKGYFICLLLVSMMYVTIMIYRNGKKTIVSNMCTLLVCMCCISVPIISGWQMVTAVKAKENITYDQLDYEKLIQQVEYFDTFTLENKMAYLQELITLERKKLGIQETIEVYATTLNKNTNGLYRVDMENAIFLNKEYVSYEDTYSVIKTALHELHHCYANKVVSVLTKEILNSNLVYFDKVNAWADNYFDYIDSEEVSFEEYYTQPIEMDANKWAKERMAVIYGDTIQK